MFKESFAIDISLRNLILEIIVGESAKKEQESLNMQCEFCSAPMVIEKMGSAFCPRCLNQCPKCGQIFNLVNIKGKLVFCPGCGNSMLFQQWEAKLRAKVGIFSPKIEDESTKKNVIIKKVRMRCS